MKKFFTILVLCCILATTLVGCSYVNGGIANNTNNNTDTNANINNGSNNNNNNSGGINQVVPKTLYLDPNGGRLSQTSVTVTTTYGMLPVPEKDNHVFMGWYTSLSGGELVNNYAPLKFNSNESTIYARWAQESTEVTLGLVQTERHKIRKWSSWGHNEDFYGEDSIQPNLERDALMSLGYTKIKVTMTFEYKVDDWGDQLIQILSKNGTELKRFEYEWDERGWTTQTVEYEISLNDVNEKCGFGVKWYLFKDGTNSDTWFVGKTVLDISAVK